MLNFLAALTCGPVRANPGSPVEEIVLIVYDDMYTFTSYIFNIASSSWRASKFSFSFAFMADMQNNKQVPFPIQPIKHSR